jgi:hypothetical protein
METESAEEREKVVEERLLALRGLAVLDEVARNAMKKVGLSRV